MARKALIDYSLLKELSDSFCKKNRRSFEAKLKNSFINEPTKKSKNKGKLGNQEVQLLT